MRDDDKLLTHPDQEYGSGVIGVCDICGVRQAIIVLDKERYKLCVIDFLNKTWLKSEKTPGAPLPPYRSDRIWFETDEVSGGKAAAIRLVPTKVMRHPVVLITPDTYGITTTLLDAAIRFAKEGLEVLIPDIGRTIGVGMKEHAALRAAGWLRGGVSIESPPVARLIRLYQDALAHLRAGEMIDPNKSALFGTSYGASLALGLAAQDVRLTATALAYPAPTRPVGLVTLVTAPLLFVTAGGDAASRKSEAQFREVAPHLKATVEFAPFPRARRDFLARDKSSYDLATAEAAWAKITEFLRRNLLPPPPRPAAPPVRTTLPPPPLAAKPTVPTAPSTPPAAGLPAHAPTPPAA
ncbi:MAG: dienelactone hydrolase family protein [Thermoplasmata archaeon]